MSEWGNIKPKEVNPKHLASNLYPEPYNPRRSTFGERLTESVATLMDRRGHEEERAAYINGCELTEAYMKKKFEEFLKEEFVSKTPVAYSLEAITENFNNYINKV